MAYLKELERSNIRVSETLSINPPDKTLLYLHIGGRNQVELEEVLDCIFLDNKKSFKLVDIKRVNNLVSALVILDRNVVEKF